ncbi:hypothetical protein HPB49_011870 [Dermacentor silvarum]|uniref:Uncharacterized protein n=1 Tax=Dermacentor silvarum TaxID=543639 RepID=A0ACB8DD41_DERSI|nr:hypothetical protein HPB49_011870 [Dermacentor silvarum]
MENAWYAQLHRRSTQEPVTESVTSEQFYFPCTRTTDNRVCRLVRYLSACNRLLYRLGIQLEEQDDDDQGDLQLVSVPGKRFGAEENGLSASGVSFTLSLLISLLESHRCIVVVDVDYIAASALGGVLNNMPALKRVSVSRQSSTKTSDVQLVCDAVAFLKQIKELRIFNNGHAVYLELRSVHTLLRLNTTLTSLDIGHLETSKSYSLMLTQALIENSRITRLAVSSCIFTCGPTNSAEAFAKYLAKKNSALQSLTLKAFRPVDRHALTNLTEAISAADTLQDLDAELQLGCLEEMSLLAKTLKNWSLRRVNIARVKCCERFLQPRTAVLLRQQLGRIVQPWLSVIAENSSLLTLSMNLSGLGTEECCALLRAVRRNKSLQCVSLCNLPAGHGLREACSVIQDGGMTHRVIIEDHHLSPENITVLRDCTLVTSVTVSYKDITDRDILIRAFIVLSECPHVTSLSVKDHLDVTDETVMMTMAVYIQQSLTLRNLRLSLQGRFYDSLALYPRESASPVIMALSSNCRLRSVSLHMRLSDVDCQSLAEAVSISPLLSELSFPVSRRIFNVAFLSYLSPYMSRNYTLLRIDVPSVPGYETKTWAIRNIARRNYNIFCRAARFVMGHRDPQCARALALVSDHPNFVELIQSKARVGAAEAAAMISRASKTCNSLDEFMKMAGVVKHRVECFPRRDGKAQLVHLNEYCWLEVTKYLSLLDVEDN